MPEVEIFGAFWWAFHMGFLISSVFGWWVDVGIGVGSSVLEDQWHLGVRVSFVWVGFFFWLFSMWVS